MVTSASLIELASGIYTRNLAEFFCHDTEITEWLTEAWEKEELQHGQALKRYVQTAWPDLDWDAAYQGFIAELSHLYSVDRLAPTHALEMAGRCAVESGTASFYRMVSEFTTEPVLKELAAKISADEVRHYKHFYRYFRRYRDIERPHRLAILRTLWNRCSEMDAEDVLYAVKYISTARNPAIRWQRSEYEAVRDASLSVARRHFPYTMATKMLLKPLGLNALGGRVVLPAAAAAARLFFTR
jgi:rubrerythrin